MSAHPWMMRVLAGVHAGAEAVLTEEQAVLGAAEDCDFVLDDDALADRHIGLRAGAAGPLLTVLDTGTPVLLDGHEVRGEVQLEPYQVISIGALSLAVGPADAAWPKVELPTASGGDPAPGEAADVEPDAVPAPDPVTQQSGDDPEPASAAPPRPKHGPGRWVAVTAAAVGGALLIAAAGWSLTPRAVERGPADADDIAAEIRTLASRHGAIVDVAEDAAAPGTFQVTGHIDTEAREARMLEDLTQAGVRATVRLVSTEELLEYATAALNQSAGLDPRNDLGARPVPDSVGKIQVHGYVEDHASLSELQAILERDVREARGIAYEVQTRADRLADLRRRLAQSGLGDRFHLQRFEDRVGLFGPVQSAEELSEINRIVEAFNTEFEYRPPLRLSGTETFLGESTIELDVRAVVLGEDPHVVLHDGERYGQGSRIAGSYVVATLTERYMILEAAGTVVGRNSTGAPEVAYFVFDR